MKIEASKSAVMTDVMLWQCLSEAEQRKHDDSLTIEARDRAALSYSLCLWAANMRGHTYQSLKVAATGSAQ